MKAKNRKDDAAKAAFLKRIAALWPVARGQAVLLRAHLAEAPAAAQEGAGQPGVQGVRTADGQVAESRDEAPVKGASAGDFAREAKAVKSKIVELAGRSARDPELQNAQNIFREHADRMYHWARGPDIPAENNRAERGVRGLVIARKTSFGGLSEGALRVREVNQSVMETLALRCEDLAAKLAQALDVYAATGRKSAVRDFLFPRAGRLDCAKHQAQR